MFSSLTEQERQEFLTQTYDCFIPGYTGHCPTLKFHYGKPYGTKTQEILKDMRKKRFHKDLHSSLYREQDYKNNVLKPIVRTKGQFQDYALDCKYRAPRYITGYTGFVPTLNFRYGKSYSRAADDSIYEYSNKQRRVYQAQEEVDRMFRAKSAPRMTSIRSKDEVQQTLKEYIEREKFQDQRISPQHPPIAGYTGHIPRVKGNEQSLSQRYNTVVKRGLTLLQEEREKFKSLKKAQNQVVSVLEDYENLHNAKDI